MRIIAYSESRYVINEDNMMKEAYMRPQDIVILLKIDEKKGVIMGTNGTFNNTRAHIWLKGLNKKILSKRAGLSNIRI
jgi:hypothetical protein